MAINLWASMCKSGLAAARPTTPETVANLFVFYYATDTGALSMWNGAAWVSITTNDAANNVAVAPVTVANLPAAPKNGQLAFVSDATAPAIGATVAGSGAVICGVMYNLGTTAWKVI